MAERIELNVFDLESDEVTDMFSKRPQVGESLPETGATLILRKPLSGSEGKFTNRFCATEGRPQICSACQASGQKNQVECAVQI